MENSKLMIAIDLLVVVYIYLLVSVSFFRVYSIYVKIMWAELGENCLCPETTKPFSRSVNIHHHSFHLLSSSFTLQNH